MNLHIFKGKYADNFYLQLGYPFENLSLRIIIPPGRDLNIKNNNTTLSPIINKSANGTIYEWKCTNTDPLHLETKTPGWYDPYPVVFISEYKNWNEVSKWATELFPKNIPLSADLKHKINSIKERNATNEARTLAALKFVQDDVRYMGIEMGVNSHKPSNPNKIFNQRFGDCKDKSYLLVTMLNAMGIEADAILINTREKKSLNNCLPTAGAFDHVTVQTRLANKLYYFDPTISFQRGSIDDISYPDYQAGLVINDATTGLASIPHQEKGFVDIKEVIDVKDMLGRATLKVVTKRTGLYADENRDYFNNYSLYEIKNKYKDFYAAYFDNITADSLTYNDDDVTGTFTTTEYYTIKSIWKAEGEKQRISVDAYVINSLMSKPTDQNRKMPFYLSYPTHYKEQVEVNMPQDWSADLFDNSVACSAFTLHASAGLTGKTIILKYEYETLKDHVLPEEAPAFFAKYDEARGATAYDVTYKAGEAVSLYDSPSATTSSSGSSSSSSVFPKLYLLLGICVLVTILVRSNKKKQA
ncbi:MAG TPA: transglutaminase family protein [Segetibacter sp.]